MNDYITKDSGERREFDSGARRDVATGKGRPGLISPIAEDRLARVLERGAAKYGDRNWEKGMPLSVYVDSLLRHLRQYREGQRDEDHLGQAMFNLMALIHTEELVVRGLLPPTLADLSTLVAPGEDEASPGWINVGPGRWERIGLR